VNRGAGEEREYRSLEGHRFSVSPNPRFGFLQGGGLQGIVEEGALKYLEHGAPEIEGHELGKGEGDRDVVLHGVEERPEALPVHIGKPAV